MSAKFTPGPWRLDHSTSSVGPGFNTERVFVVSQDGKEVSGTIHHVTELDGPTNWKGWRFPTYVKGEAVPYSPDAHLIAAAPDLYEVLERIVSAGHWYPGALEIDPGQDGEELERIARAALAKARGEA